MHPEHGVVAVHDLLPRVTGDLMTLIAEERLAQLEKTAARPVIDGRVHWTKTVAHMRYSPAFLVSCHSQVMPLFWGDLILAGTPGAVQVRAGDTVKCHIAGIGVLTNPVIQG